MTTDSLQQYIDLYRQQQSLLTKGSHPLISEHRAAALQFLEARGLPTRKDERYKYTDVAAVLEPDFGLNLGRLSLQFDPRQTYRCRVPGLGSSVHYVVGDSVAESNVLIDDGSLFVGSMVEFAQRYPDILRAYYNKVEGDSLAALNTLLVQDGLVIRVAKGRKVADLLQIVNLSVGSVPMLANRRQLIIMEQGAEASILNCNHSATRCSNLATEVVEGVLAEGSHLQYYSVEETTNNCNLLNTTQFVQHESSKLDYASITLNSGLSRRTINITLDGTHAQTAVSGLVLANDNRHIDNNLLVVHNAPLCSSDILYKYVLDGSSIGAFAGKVLVNAQAQKTDSQETNANLCVSPTARMFTQPMLEIYADDVKCNHGSTVGQLDDTALFYMAQRGITPEEGRLLLQQAFAWDVLQRIDLLPLRQRLMHMVEERFRRGAGACGDCVMCAG
ncbi:MAG: Fe-S cluster assembly protein SufD [Bacteroidaceae bacterium]|nr:Fe-S cluster assembly protein SufD [Bacteroidaceae bacterium]